MTNANHRLPFSPAQMSETLGIWVHCISPSLSEQLNLERSTYPFGKKSFLINWNVCTHNCRECLTFALMGQQCVQWNGFVLFFLFPACLCITGIQITGSNLEALLSMGSDHPVHKSSQRLGLSKGKLCCILYLLQGTRLWETVLNQSSNFPQTTGIHIETLEKGGGGRGEKEKPSNYWGGGGEGKHSSCSRTSGFIFAQFVSVWVEYAVNFESFGLDKDAGH